MKKYFLASAVLCASLLSASAQVNVNVELDQDKYLPAEEIMVGVRIVNRSGQTLHLAEDADWIQFSIEKVEGGAVHELVKPPVQGAFDLESTKKATVTVDVAPCFDLRQAGRYLISARVKIKNWDQTLTAKPVAFEVIEGTKLWEQDFGVPVEPGSSRLPDVRRYTLQQANYLKDQLRLYLRVSDTDGRVIKLINVGRMISFGQPEPQLDKRSRLHLLYQDGARNFSYLIVTPDGDIKVRQTFEYTETRPRLRLDDTGEIAVTGGVRRQAASDVPAPTQPKDDAKKLEP